MATPRIILLICLAILIYFSLSLYHSRQVNEYQETADKGVQADWVQLSTPGSKDNRHESKKTIQQAVTNDAQNDSASSKNISQDMLPGQNLTAEDSIINTLRQQLQTTGEEKEKLRLLFEEEAAENKQLSLQANEFHARLSQQQAALQQANKQLYERNQSLENATSKIAELSEKQTALTQQLHDLDSNSSQVDSLKSSLQEKTLDIAKANERITALSMRAEQVSQDLVQAEKTINRLQSALTASQSASAKENRNEQKLKEKLFRSQEENKKHLAEIGSLHTRMDAMKSRLSILENGIKKAELKAEAMLRYGQEQSKKLEPSIEEIKTLQDKFDEQQNLLAQARQELDLHKQGKLRLQQELTVKVAEQEQVSDLHEQLKLQSAASNAAENRINELTGKLQNSEEQLSLQKTVINELTATLEQAHATLNEAGKKTAALVAEQAAIQKQLQTDIEQTTGERDQLQAVLAENKKNTEKLSADLASVNGQLQTLTAENKKFRLALLEKDERLAKTAASLQEAERESRQLQKIQQELHQKNKALEKAGVNIDKLNQQLKKDKKSLAQSQAALSKLEKTLAEENKNKAGSSLIINSQQEKINSLNDLAGKRKKELEQLTANLSKKSTENRNLTKRIAELEQETKTLQQAEQDTKHNMELAKSLQAELDQREKAFITMQEDFLNLQSSQKALQKQYNELMLKVTDSDNDGVADADDDCPDTPAEASVDTRGCEQDSDGDGLVERLDLCPDTPDNGDVNEFGCRADKPIVLQGVVFESGTVELSQSAEESLKKTVRILQMYPGKRFEIGGHTDSAGELEWNQTVSRKRAESVKNYLLSKGIDQGRLEAKGYGAEVPVADNETHGGRAANRRVELKIIGE